MKRNDEIKNTGKKFRGLSGYELATMSLAGIDTFTDMYGDKYVIRYQVKPRHRWYAEKVE